MITIPSPLHAITIGHAIVPKLQQILDLQKYHKIFIITDEEVLSRYSNALEEALYGKKVRVAILSQGEGAKNIQNLEKLYEEMIDFNLHRDDLIITVGGGVIGDVGGFAASTYMRGIDYIQIPTTLLSMVDSSIGGKVAINIGGAKNMVGSFYLPRAVVVDTGFLPSLPEGEYASGMAEIIKIALLQDGDFVESLLQGMDEEAMIVKAIKAKLYFAEQDEKDRENRILLNFGHTVGHALEKIFGEEGMSHGEAVSIGMAAAVRLGIMKGITKEEIEQKLYTLQLKYRLPSHGFYGNTLEVVEAMMKDKKHIKEGLEIVLLKDLGEATTMIAKKEMLTDLARMAI